MKKINIAQLSIIIFIISVFFVRWIFNLNVFKIVSPILLIIIIICHKEKIIMHREWMSTIILCLYIFFNIATTQNGHPYLIEEIFKYNIVPISTLIVYLYIAKSYQKNPIENKKRLKKLYIFINIYYVINLIIMILQLHIPYFLMFQRNSNTFYIDLITGMFGLDATHRLTLLYISALLINLYYFNSTNKRISSISKVMFTFILLSSIIISTENDNRAYYFVLIIFMIYFLYFIFHKKGLKVFFKNMMKVAVIILVIAGMYLTSNRVKMIVDNEIIERFITRTQKNLTGTQIHEERLLLYQYALDNGNGRYMGMGIGNVKIIGDSRMPKHFGISEITSRVYNGGIIYIILLLLLYLTFFIDISSTQSRSIKVIIFILTLFLVIYQQVFTIPDETFLAAFMFELLGLSYNRGIKNEKQGI